MLTLQWRMKDRLQMHDPAKIAANDQARINVKELMTMRRLNQAELAERLGQSQPWLSKRLTGATPFQIEDLDLIGDFFGLTAAQLLQPGYGAQDRRSGDQRRTGMDRRRLGERFESVRGRRRLLPGRVDGDTDDEDSPSGQPN